MEKREEKLLELFKKYLDKDFGQKAEERDTNILGDPYYLPPRELVLLFIEVEREFDLKVSSSFIVEGKFTSFNNIYKLVIA